MAKAQSNVVRTLQEVADHFGVSTTTVKGNWRGCGMPGKRGAWDLKKIAEWKRLRERDPDGSGTEEEDEELKALRLRKLQLETEIRELETIKRKRLERIASGDVVSRSAVEAEVSQACGMIRHQFQQLPRLMAANFPSDCRQSLVDELRRLIDKTLTSAAENLQRGVHVSAAKAKK